jgi:hypothetical protein
MTRLFFGLLFLSVLSACANVDFGSPNTYQRSDVRHTGNGRFLLIARCPERAPRFFLL